MKTLIFVLFATTLTFAQTASELDLLLARIDASNLQTPITALPRSVLQPEASSGIADLPALAAVLGEPLETMTSHRATDYLQGATSSWDLELYPADGTFTAIEKEALWLPRYTYWLSKPPAAVDHVALEGRALALLAELGVQADEIGEVVCEDIMVMEMDAAGQPLLPRLHGYVVAVDRAYADVPVAGSFAIVGFNLDGSLHKLMGSWPRQAAEGHRLAPAPAPAETARLVAEALLAEGREGEGPILLSYLYDTRTTQAGSLMMDLKVQATFLETREGEKIQAPSFDLPSLR